VDAAGNPVPLTQAQEQHALLATERKELL
jgi:hypothetical protein